MTDDMKNKTQTTRAVLQRELYIQNKSKLFRPNRASHYAAVVAPERRRLRRDFLRSAFAQWITPFLAALSNAEIAALNAVLASSLLPFFNAVKNFLSRVLKRDLTLLFTNCLRALLRTLRSADFLLGISYFYILQRPLPGVKKPHSFYPLSALCQHSIFQILIFIELDPVRRRR